VGDLVVIGYGNELRGDDAVGAVVARRLRDCRLPDGVKVIVCHCLMPELAADISTARWVVFVDSSVEVDLQSTTAGSITHRELSGATPDLSPLGHTLDPRSLLELAKRLYHRSPRAELFTVTGERFEIGDTMSPEVVQAAGELVARIVARLSMIRGILLCDGQSASG
jgi:hydrogenase maturation protease